MQAHGNIVGLLESYPVVFLPAVLQIAKAPASQKAQSYGSYGTRSSAANWKCPHVGEAPDESRRLAGAHLFSAARLG